MKTTFGRLFSVTALIVLVAVVGMGASFRALVKNYLIDEREEDLRATAAAVAELAAKYAGYSSGAGSDVALAFHMNLSFASQVAQTDALVCDTGGQVVTCSCQELVCRHIGLTLDPDYVQQALQTGQDFRTGVLTGIYDDERYLAAQPCLMSDGTVGGLVVVSEPVRGMGIILSQIIQMFIFVALIVLLLTVMCISIFTQNSMPPLKGHGQRRQGIRPRKSQGPGGNRGGQYGGNRRAGRGV